MKIVYGDSFLTDRILMSQLAYVLIFVLSGCYSDDEPARDPDVKNYIFLGHTYRWGQSNDDPKIDGRIEDLDFRPYDGIWLGGDIVHTLTKQKTIDELDRVFDLSATSTNWAVGNHDMTDGGIELIRGATRRNDFYSTSFDGIVLLVLNTPMLSDAYNYGCDAHQGQYQLIQQVLDTITEASHLIILTHYILWASVIPEIDVPAIANSNQQWVNFICEQPSNFKTAIYPQLLEVQSRGVDVLLIGGDGGQKHKGHYYENMDGVQFYISGINNSIGPVNAALNGFNFEPDSVLVFRHDIKSRVLTHEFTELNSL